MSNRSVKIMSGIEKELSGETEKRIIKAATIVFVRKGRTGASMQDIANEAGINRTLLNYYFRSKDKLFTMVFDNVFLKLISEAFEILNSDLYIIKKLEAFIDVYINGLLNNPHIPVFILNELNTHPDHLIRFYKNAGFNSSQIIQDLQKAMDEGLIIKMDPTQLIVNLISLIVFPFAAKPLVCGMIISDQDIEFEEFIKARIPSLKEYFLKSITL